MRIKDRFKIGRIEIVFAFLFLLGGVLLFDLYRKQVVEHEFFAEAAREQSVFVERQPADRGRIFATDRDGRLYNLAANEWQYDLLLSPRQIRNPEATLAELVKSLPTLDLQAARDQIATRKVYVPPIVSGISPSVAREIYQRNLMGVFLVPRLVRVYSEGSTIAAQLLGFLGADGSGKYGVEAAHDQELRGQVGDTIAKRDALGRIINVIGQTAPTLGADLILTIDYNLQFQVENKLEEALTRFKADSGSIVVLDPQTGAILAMAGQPTFDPNRFFEVALADRNVFLPPAIFNAYEPGSIIKPITMATALELGLVTPELTRVFGGSVTIAGHTIRNAENRVFGRQTMTGTIENSDNIAMVWLSEKIGPERQRQFLDRFGFGRKTGVDLVGEQTGVLRPSNEWNQLLQATASFGQGISATTLQMAQSYAVIANGGRTVTPHLAREFRRGERVERVEPELGETIISPEVAKQVREMLVSVVERTHGRRARVEGVRVAGKTGTSQVADPDGGYALDRHIGSFAGFFPADEPRFVMVVRIDNPRTVRFAESSAAPIFGELANWMATYYRLR